MVEVLKQFFFQNIISNLKVLNYATSIIILVMSKFKVIPVHMKVAKSDKNNTLIPNMATARLTRKLTPTNRLAIEPVFLTFLASNKEVWHQRKYWGIEIVSSS